MTDLGLTRIDREDATWLVLDPTKTRVRTCTVNRHAKLTHLGGL
ncbi:hypothetical protein PhaeoP97_00052 [Phaeobacter porticola]|uniref:Uncharacterized protein n=1 Tax=Phaeobacter porticola TaxID=1844006 RepID=A0A1L3I054_9RHOB|nr:hypothetical protein PhaeoP97_00052 [Phaeobacter porticola]